MRLSATARVAALSALVLTTAVCSEDTGTAVVVNLVVDATVDETALALVDRLRVESSESGYAKEIPIARRLQRTGESFVYRAERTGVPFNLSVRALGISRTVACGEAQALVAAAGRTNTVTVILSVCSSNRDDGGAAGAFVDGASPDAGISDAVRSDDAMGGIVAPDAPGAGQGADLSGAAPFDALRSTDASPTDVLSAADAVSQPDSTSAEVTASTDAAPFVDAPIASADAPADAATDLPPPQMSGAICSADNQCASGFCTRGLCCNERCEAACRTCAGPGRAGTCTDVPASECVLESRITEISSLQCVGGGFNPEGDGPQRGSNRSAGSGWELSLTIGDPSPACVRNTVADPPCAAGAYEVDLGFSSTVLAP